MKVISKILTLNFIIMLIFWSLGQPGHSWSAAKLQQQSENSQVNNQDPLGDKFAKFKNDSLAALLCDKNPPYFTNLYPDSGQQCIDFCSIIKFTVNDDSLTKRNDWDSAGVDTNQIFISIETRFWTKNKADSVRPQKINLADSLYKVDCEYYPDQPYDWSDTVTVHLSATDRSYFKNHAETTYVFYSIRDTIPPVLTPIYPERNATGVPIDTGIVIQGFSCNT